MPKPNLELLSKEKAVKIFITAIAGFLLSFISLVCFQYLFENVFVGQANSIDISLAKSIFFLRSPVLTTLMLTITSFGADITVFGVFLIALIFLIRKRKKEALVFSMSVFIGIFISIVLKWFFHRTRPSVNPLLSLSDYSYPSTHAMNSFIFYSLLAYYLIIFTKRSVLEVTAAVFSILMILLVGFSRIYLGVHYPTDVLGGYIAGFWITWAVIRIDHILQKYSH